MPAAGLPGFADLLPQSSRQTSALLHATVVGPACTTLQTSGEGLARAGLCRHMELGADRRSVQEEPVRSVRVIQLITQDVRGPTIGGQEGFDDDVGKGDVHCSSEQRCRAEEGQLTARMIQDQRHRNVGS